MTYYKSTGTIQWMSDIVSGQTDKGNEWARMDILLEIAGANNSISRQMFSVSKYHINEVTQFTIGDKVEVEFTLTAREWKGKWYNNVDLQGISPVGGSKAEEPAPAPAPQFDENGETTEEDLPF